MENIAYTDKNGNLRIVFPAPKEHLQKVFGPMTEKQYEDHVISRSIPEDATNITFINEDNIPNDRIFRGAWFIDEQKNIAVNMDIARDIHMANIRNARDAALRELDKKTLMGIDVQAEKQVIRDIPQNIDLTTASTPEELKKIWPEELL